MRRAFPVAFAALLAALGLAGAWLLFTTFRTYDDEGYVLFSLATFSREGGLYTHVYSQYGPFFFLVADLAHRLLGFEFTNTAGRVITLFHWLGAALLCGHLVWRHTRSAAWSLFALAATFGHLWQMTSEPMHPGGFIVFIVALAAWAGAEFISRDSPRGLALVGGLAGAALVLTKVNVGALFIAGAGAWLLVHSAGPRASRIGPWLAALGVVTLPWALMRSLLTEPWVIRFSLIVGASGLAVILAARDARRPLLTAGGWRWCIGSGLAFLAVVVVGASLRGTGPHELLEGVLLAPLRHPGVYSFAINWRVGAPAFALVSLALCVFTLMGDLRRPPRFVTALATARLAIAAIAATSWLGWLPLNPLALVMSYGLACTWLFVLPLATSEESHRAARLRAWLAFLAVTQSLHAYPVGGSQIGWGTFLWAPLLAAAAAEATAVLRERVARFAGPLAIAAAAGIAVALLRVGATQWRDSETLALPGAAELHLEPVLATELRVLTVNAAAHCDLLFSLPGMFSFNLWTGLPTPTAANVTHWFNLLGPAQQSEIIAQLDAHPRAGVMVERDVLSSISRAGIPVRGPLRDYLYAHFEAAFAAGSHEFWVRRGRAVAPLGTVRFLYRSTNGTRERVRIEVVTTAAAQRIAQIEWVEDGRLRTSFTPANTRAEFEPLHIDGAAAAPPAPGWNTPLPPIARLVLYTDDPAALAPPQRGALFRLRDAAGALIADTILRD
ncbi:MAG: hypothetical protein NTV51_16295 [Verrucomicrobia bacterium]|nr:hypothetical protein [Verrucomicrobiota bacterium]